MVVDFSLAIEVEGQGWKVTLTPNLDFSHGEVYILDVDWAGAADECTTGVRSGVRTSVFGAFFNIPITHHYGTPGDYYITLRVYDPAQPYTQDTWWGVILTGTELGCSTQTFRVSVPRALTFISLSDLQLDFNDGKNFVQTFGLAPTSDGDPTDTWPDNQTRPDVMYWGAYSVAPYYPGFWWNMQSGQTDWTEEGIDVRNCALYLSGRHHFGTAGPGDSYNSTLTLFNSWYSNNFFGFDEFSFEIVALPDFTKGNGGYSLGAWWPGMECGISFFGGPAPAPYGPNGCTFSFMLWQKEDEGATPEIVVTRLSYTSNLQTDHLGDYDPVAHKYIKIRFTEAGQIGVYASADRSSWVELYDKAFADGMVQADQIPLIQWFPHGRIRFWTGSEYDETSPGEGFWIIDNINKVGPTGCGSMVLTGLGCASIALEWSGGTAPYSGRYSVDGGTTWTAMFSNVFGETYTFDASVLVARYRTFLFEVSDSTGLSVQQSVTITAEPPMGDRIALVLGTEDDVVRYRGFEDLTEPYEAILLPNPVAPAGIGADCLFRTLFVALTHTCGAEIVATPILDGVRYDAEAVRINLAATTTPLTERFEIPLYHRHSINGTEQLTHGLRGVWFTVELRTLGYLSCGEVVFEGLDLEWDKLRESEVDVVNWARLHPGERYGAEVAP